MLIAYTQLHSIVYIISLNLPLKTTGLTPTTIFSCFSLNFPIPNLESGGKNHPRNVYFTAKQKSKLKTHLSQLLAQF